MNILSREDIIDAVRSFNAEELQDLVNDFQVIFGISLLRTTAPVIVTNGDDIIVEEPTAFTFILVSPGDKKINVIKTVREVTALGLKEAKEIVDSAPKTVQDNLTATQADALKLKFEAEGATVSVVPMVN